MNQPKVCIITLNWNGLEDTIECLESLKKITYPNYEVIVVDNGSEGNDAQVLEEKFGDYIHLIKNDRNYGVGAANNMAIRHALNNSNPDYILLLNNDTAVDPEFLTELVKVAEADPAIALTGAKVYFYDEPERLQPSLGKIDLWTGDPISIAAKVKRLIGIKDVDQGQYDSITEVEFIPAGWCSLIRRQSLETIGSFDKRHFFGWEDVDYCIRARKAGYKIVLSPKAKIWHKSRSAGKIDGFLQYYGSRDRFRLMKKHASKWQFLCFLLYFFGVHFGYTTVYYLIYHRRPRPLLRFYKGIRDGLFKSGDKD